MTTAAKCDLLERPHQRTTTIFCVLAMLSIWFARPLSWIPIGLVDMPHHLELPVETLLALLAIPVILSSRRLPYKSIMIGAGIFLACLTFNWIKFQSPITAGGRLAAFILVPWATALAFSTGGRRQRLVTCLTALWLWQVVLSIWGMAFGQEVIGSAGNRNWQAAFMLALLPWVWSWASRFSLKPTRTTIRTTAVFLTLFLLLKCESRAAWLALASGLFIMLLTQ